MGFSSSIRAARAGWLGGVLGAMLLIGAGAAVAQGDPAGGEKPADSEKGPPVRVTAETLVADDRAKTAEFSGNVRAVQGDTVILSDRLAIHYAGDPADAGASAETAGDGGAASGIRELVATGNVRITFDGIVAESPEAVYTTADRVLVLSGPGSRVTRPDSGTIAGPRIVVHRDDGRIRFEGGVEGLFFPGERGLE